MTPTTIPDPLDEIARALVRRQLDPGYAAVLAIGHLGGGSDPAPYETSLLMKPNVDLDATLKTAWSIAFEEIARSYVERHGVKRGVVCIRTSVGLAGDGEPSLWLPIHASSIGARYVSEPLPRATLTVVQGGRT